MHFFKNGVQEGKTAPVLMLAPLWERGHKDVDGEYSGNIMYSCMKMEKIRLVEIIQEWGDRG
jgi:hypothetical protein